MTKRLQQALKIQKKHTQQKTPPVAGSLGVYLGSQKLTEVPNRKPFVYVRLRDNPNEVIQAFNNKVSPSWNLPVLLEWSGGRYVVTSVDSLRYQNTWTTYSPYLPRHGNTHSFDLDNSGGGDITWIQSRQFMPALIVPSGSVGGPNVLLSPYTLKNSDGSWRYVGNTGTASLLPYIPPSSNQAVMGLVYLDSLSGNPYFIINSGSYFSNIITGSAAVVPYIPSLSNPNLIPLAAIRLTSGTNTIGWNNIYDMRQFIHTTPTGTGGGGGGGITGSPDSTYLRLDTANNPLTGQLSIIPSLSGIGGLYAQTTDDAFTGDFEQYGSMASYIGSATLFLYRTTSDFTAVQFDAPMLDAWQDKFGVATVTGPFIRFRSDGVNRFLIDPSAQGTGTYAYIDGDSSLSNGNLLMLANNGTNKTRISSYGSIDFGLDVTREPNAGRIGYELFGGGYLHIVGAGTSAGQRWVLIYDKLKVSDHLQTNTAQTLNLTSSWLYANSTGTFSGPINAPDASFVTGSFFVLGTDGSFNSNRFSVTRLLTDAGPDILIPVDGWIPKSETWTRTGNYTFTVVGDVTAKYRKGAKVRYKDGGSYEYGVILSSTYGAPNTTVTLFTNTDYAMAAATITDRYISYIENPEGFPGYFNYTTTVSATSGAITSYTVNKAKFKVNGQQVEVVLDFTVNNNGTGAGNLTVTAPAATADLAAGTFKNINTLALCSLSVGPSASTIGIVRYDGVYPITTGTMRGFYLQDF